MCVEYADAFRGFTEIQIAAGVAILLRNRKERSWPTPAEITEAANQVSAAAVPTDQRESFMDRLRKRDNMWVVESQRLQRDFETQQVELYAMARAEGFEHNLRGMVRDAAEMIALRSERRAAGRVPSVPAGTDGGVELENIRSDNDRDWIVIRQKDIALWRERLALPVPAVPTYVAGWNTASV